MRTDWKELADDAKVRSDMYGLLANVFREEPTEALIKELRDPGISGVFSDMEAKLGETFYSDPVPEVTERLMLEFTRLFIGPSGHISPHESVFVESDGGVGGLWGAKTVEVKKFIESTGLDYETRYKGIPDHISVELEFMQKMTEWESDNWMLEEAVSAEQSRSVQNLFLEDHLLCWVFELGDRISAQAESEFYRVMAELLKQFMNFERQDMQIDVAA